jgi:pilus assembly protein CpaC
VLIDGKAPGRVSLILWGADERLQYEVVVEGPSTALQQEIQAFFPGEDIRVTASDDAIILSGRVSNPDVMVRAVDLVESAAPKNRVVNLLQLPGGAPSQQVMLEVRFAEVNRRALTELGVSFFTGTGGFKDFVGRTTTQQFAAPDFEGAVGAGASGDPDSQLTFSDFLNLFIFNTEHSLGALIRALQARGYFQSLAEPNLIAYNGQEASFLAGGEIPVPVVQGISGAVSISYKKFGIRLTFTPAIAGDLIRLRVRPEVSALDFANGITLQGFRVPALTTRRAETQVELRSGQSFAIAGLLGNIAQEDQSKLPLLGDIPILGPLFRSRANRAERTELLVLITPRLVAPLDPNEVPRLPVRPERFLGPEESSQ